MKLIKKAALLGAVCVAMATASTSAQAWWLGSGNPVANTCHVCTTTDPSNSGWCVYLAIGESIPNFQSVKSGLGHTINDEVDRVSVFNAKMILYKHPNYKRKFVTINSNGGGVRRRNLIKSKRNEASSAKCVSE